VLPVPGPFVRNSRSRIRPFTLHFLGCELVIPWKNVDFDLLNLLKLGVNTAGSPGAGDMYRALQFNTVTRARQATTHEICNK